jgi:hypothetical protein
MTGLQIQVAILANATEKLTSANKHIVTNTFYTKFATRFLKLPLKLKKLFRAPNEDSREEKKVWKERERSREGEG